MVEEIKHEKIKENYKFATNENVLNLLQTPLLLDFDRKRNLQ